MLIGQTPIQNSFGVKKIKLKVKKENLKVLAGPGSGQRLQGRTCPASHSLTGLAATSLQPLLSPQAASPVWQTPHHTSLIRTPVTGLRVHLVLTGNVRPPPDSSLHHVGQDPWAKQDDSQSSGGWALTAPNGPPRVGREDAMSPRPVPTAPLAPLRMPREEEPREEEEEPRSSRQRTTDRPGCGGQTPAARLSPRAPDRQHDRRAAPSLLLHRTEG